jgi:hypothetical protein
MQLLNAKNSLAYFFICAIKKIKNHLLALPFNSREKRKERRMRTYPFYFIFLSVFFPLKSPPPSPPSPPSPFVVRAPGTRVS